ncbi:CAP domain-containing protein [Kitasatospora indigofera]|uniref:CAP domain-containing protein n=1 Tax=Kitasatospora indigofera TaxID=67307 RepID=UPI0036A9CEED
MNSDHPVTGHARAEDRTAVSRHGRRRGRRKKPSAAPRLFAVLAGSVALGGVASWYATVAPPAGSGARPAAASAPDKLLAAQLAEPQVPGAPTGSPTGSPAPAAGQPSATPSAGAAPSTAAPAPSPTATAGTPQAAPATGTAARPTATASATPAPAKSSPAAGAPAGGKAAQFIDQVAALVNTERANHGCAPVAVNAKLQSAAQVHSDDMAARDYFDHADPEGHHADTRINATGYKWSRWGENIARGQQDAAAVMEAWMNSPGHRANILNCDFKEIGVGVTLGSGGPWWTQVFATAG